MNKHNRLGTDSISISVGDIENNPGKDFGRVSQKHMNSGSGSTSLTAKIAGPEKASKDRFFGKYSDAAKRVESQKSGRYEENQKPALSLVFKARSADYFCDMGRGVFIYLVQNRNQWVARAVHKGETLFVKYGVTSAQAVARLAGCEWYFHRASAEWWSLYDMYRKVHFVFPFGREKTAPQNSVVYLANKHLPNGYFIFDAPKKAERVVEKSLRITVPKYQRPTGWKFGNAQEPTFVNGLEDTFSYNRI